MTEIQAGAPQPVSPHNLAVYEAGKLMLVDSVSVGREFCKFMVGVSTGAIPLYLALLALALPKDYRPSWWTGVLAILPAALFLGAAATFAVGVFPQTRSFSLDIVEDIESARSDSVRRRGRISTIGFALFSVAALASIVAAMTALRVKAPVEPTKPTEVRLVE